MTIFTIKNMEYTILVKMLVETSKQIGFKLLFIVN